MNNFTMQLGTHGVLEQHGFARNKVWSVDENPPPFTVATSNCHIDLILKQTPEDMKIWPHRLPSNYYVS
jgi:glucose-6-phosphate 1-epimerase